MALSSASGNDFTATRKVAKGLSGTICAPSIPYMSAEADAGNNPGPVPGVSLLLPHVTDSPQGPRSDLRYEGATMCACSGAMRLFSVPDLTQRSLSLHLGDSSDAGYGLGKE
jgi:hypothetical protein